MGDSKATKDVVIQLKMLAQRLKAGKISEQFYEDEADRLLALTQVKRFETEMSNGTEDYQR